MKRLYIYAALILLNSIACGKDKGNEMESNDIYEHTNHLINENSPYLLSHAHNPVDWYPWGEDALDRAKNEDKPIFLSIGYAACHWCHVMERESFENEEIAALLNANFISIKVDREQRPDLDEIYMSFTTAMTGHGGWPMSVFLTPDLKPFFAGTYFPPDDRYGRPGFKRLITEIGLAYKESKDQIIKSSNDIFKQVSSRILAPTGTTMLSKGMIKRGAEVLMNNFDHIDGGFGQAPKFPHSLELSLFLRYYRSSGDLTYLQAAEKSLKEMAFGGIYDQIGGGFARYATDVKWLVPHFEKMLYDNALLVPVYVEAYQITGNEVYLNVVTETLDFILREMTDKTGGFYSALDADSEGEEGKFYVWTYNEMKDLLGEEIFEPFAKYYNITPGGNFEGKNILNLSLESIRFKNDNQIDNFDEFIQKGSDILFEARSKRVRPLTDDKQLTSWNGLALTAFCKGYQITGDKKYLEAAIANANFVKDELYDDGKLTHAYREGKHTKEQFLEDYAFYISGLLNLFESDQENNHKWLNFAMELTETATELFIDEKYIFYLRPDGQTDLIYRPKEESDGAIPSPGSYMIANLLKINRLTDDAKYLEIAKGALDAISGQIQRSPNRMTSALFAVDYYFNDKIEIVIVGDNSSRDEIIKELYSKFIPNKIIAVDNGNNKLSLPLLEGRKSTDGSVKVYVCRNSVCNLPVTNLEEFKIQLKEL